jgi:hypothetical protein
MGRVFDDMQAFFFSVNSYEHFVMLSLPYKTVKLVESSGFAHIRANPLLSTSFTVL